MVSTHAVRWRLKNLSEEDDTLYMISEALIALDIDETIARVNLSLKKGVSSQTIIKEGLSEGLDVIGEKFAKGEFFLSELIFAGYIVKEAMVLAEPYLEAGEKDSAGKVVLATVEGDLHDIGKNITATMLKSAGFKVFDLGVDVSADEIAKVAEEIDADIVALSALLSVVEPYVVKTIETLRRTRGDSTKVLLGGRASEAGMADRVKADAYANDAWDGIAKAKELMTSLKSVCVAQLKRHEVR
jgi:5-methyltetrahydrofolate--homocysteine methyltransferase